MGAYYMWVNATKRECLGDEPFAYGLKAVENCRYPNDRTDALLTLLAGRWAGDLVAYVSDYDNLRIMDLDGSPGLVRVREALGANPYDEMEDHGRDVCGIFSCARGCEGMLPNPDEPGDNDWRQYDGPFDTEPVAYRYVVNETRREYLDRAGGQYLGTFQRGPLRGTPIFEDPTPALLGTYLGMDAGGEGCRPGLWVGDDVRPANGRPGSGYEDVSGRYEVWGPVDTVPHPPSSYVHGYPEPRPNDRDVNGYLREHTGLRPLEDAYAYTYNVYRALTTDLGTTLTDGSTRCSYVLQHGWGLLSGNLWDRITAAGGNPRSRVFPPDDGRFHLHQLMTRGEPPTGGTIDDVFPRLALDTTVRTRVPRMGFPAGTEGVVVFLYGEGRVCMVDLCEDSSWRTGMATFSTDELEVTGAWEPVG